MIRAVIFDWGGVLIDDVIPFLTTYVAHHLGICREDALVQIGCHHVDFAKGVIDEDIFWENICKALDVEKPNGSSLWKEALKAGCLEKHDVFLLIDWLKIQGYKIGLLSNCEFPAVEFFHECNYTQFDVCVFSCEEGICKPDRRIYEIVLKRLGVASHEAIFIDDKEENVLAAQKVGLFGIVFVNPGQTRQELEFLLKKEGA